MLRLPKGVYDMGDFRTDGICHLYVDSEANLEQALKISLDSLDPKGIIAQLHFVTYTGLES